MTDERADENAEIDEAVTRAASEERPQYGVGPFSVREVALVGVWLVAFVVSFFSVATQPALGQLLLERIRVDQRAGLDPDDRRAHASPCS